MEIPLLGGRPFSQLGDDGFDVIVSESFANHHWPKARALGKRLRVAWEPENWVTVRGVVGDVRHYELDSAIQPQLYFPYHTNPRTRTTWVLVTSGSPLQLVQSLRERVLEIDPTQPLHEILT